MRPGRRCPARCARSGRSPAAPGSSPYCASTSPDRRLRTPRSRTGDAGHACPYDQRTQARGGVMTVLDEATGADREGGSAAAAPAPPPAPAGPARHWPIYLVLALILIVTI